MRINQNISALNAWRNLGVSDTAMDKSLERLSSGLRINKAADDAAGLAISEKMRGQVKGLNQAIRNAQDGISLIQTAEGALNETHSLLQRMRELAVQSSNETLQDSDRTALQAEVTQLTEEVDRIATTTEFNTKTLLSGSFATTGLSFQIGANSGQTMTVTISDASASALSISGISIGTAASAAAAISTIETALESISTSRASLGAYQNRLEHTINNLGVASENLTAAESRIRDADMASEMMSFTRDQILSQAGMAMLSQANQKPQAVLQLLR